MAYLRELVWAVIKAKERLNRAYERTPPGLPNPYPVDSLHQAERDFRVASKALGLTDEEQARFMEKVMAENSAEPPRSI